MRSYRLDLDHARCGVRTVLNDPVETRNPSQADCPDGVNPNETQAGRHVFNVPEPLQRDRNRAMRSVLMDILLEYSGMAIGIMNSGSTLASIDSPAICGWTIDRTSSWDLPLRCLMAPALA